MDMKWKAALIFAPLALASCGEMEAKPVPLTAEQTERLDRELGGKVAGAPQNCISEFNANDLVRVSDDILLYRVSRNLVYKNNLRSSCPGLARDNDITVRRTEMPRRPPAPRRPHQRHPRPGLQPGRVCALSER
jgi:hypothetical protein